jgi:hypothetical protein
MSRTQALLFYRAWGCCWCEKRLGLEGTTKLINLSSKYMSGLSLRQRWLSGVMTYGISHTK